MTREELAQKDVEFFLKTNPSSKILNSLMDLKSDFKKGDDVKILQKEYLKRKPPVYEVSLIMQIYNNYLDKKALQEYILKTDEKHLSNVIKMADVSGIDMELLQEYLLSFNTDKDKALHKYSIIFFLKRAEDKGFSANIKLLEEKLPKNKTKSIRFNRV